ncbi:hypothetical protein ABW20_dc0104883 [Dactylellina cionopaga]|nr:hypothetical protein ABW20_dc0104883 [Dactylellina cionopaga]
MSNTVEAALQAQGEQSGKMPEATAHNSGEIHKTNNIRETVLITSALDGTVLSRTRVVELSPPSSSNNQSLVAVIKDDGAPYLAQVDLTTNNLQEQIDAQGPLPLGQASAFEITPYLVNVPQETVARTELQTTVQDVSGMTRMVHIPINPESITIDRNPDAGRGKNHNSYSNTRDPEKDAPVQGITYAPGYPSTAAIVSTDAELSVYRRFDRLNARNLLYYQAEIMYLEAELDKLDEEDGLLKEPEAKYHLRHFKELWEGRDERTRRRLSVVQEIRYQLKQYNKALFYYKDLLNCSEPSERVVTSIRNWRANQGDPPIIDISEQAYDKMYEADLIALKPPKCDDPLSIFAQNNLGKFFKKPQPAHIPNSDNVLYYSETAIDLFVTIICTFLAIIVLVGSMTTLFFVESQGLRLGLVWVFTFLFAISIFLMAKLTKGEIFLATAAYCAILVVYISGG